MDSNLVFFSKQKESERESVRRRRKEREGAARKKGQTALPAEQHLDCISMEPFEPIHKSENHRGGINCSIIIILAKENESRHTRK